jgi:N-acetylneuraminic acid mutarotase
MTTGAENWLITPNRLTKSTDLKDRFQDAIQQSIADSLEKVYPDDGVFNTRLTFSGFTDGFAIIGTSEATDGDGHVLDLSQATDDGSAVPFENTAATTYYVALRSIERMSGIQINPRTGAPEYELTKEDIGELGEPDSVSDLGGTIQLNINSLLEPNVDHSGRTVMVYLNTPADNATTEAVAIETLTSTYSAPNNLITTVAQLGQSTVSTDPADYTVVVLGPTVRRDTDLRVVDGIVFIGMVTGGGAGNLPSAFDNSDQNLIDVNLSGFNAALDAFVQGFRVSTVDSSKPITGRREPLTTGVTLHTAVYYNGSIYVLGGNDASSVEQNDNVALNVASDIWTARTDIPSQSNGGAAADGRIDARACVLDGIIYYIGGTNGGVYTDLVQRYNPDTDTWLTPAANLPAARAGGAVGVINGRIYYAGGHSAAGVGEDETFEYNPDTDMWSTVAAISTAAVHEARRMAYAVVNERLYIFGGSNGASTRLDEAFVYDPAVDTWSQLENIPRLDYTNAQGNVRGHTAVAVNNVIHIMGGDWLNAGSATAAHLAYNVELDEYYIMDWANWPGCRNHASVADEDGLIYIIGGEYNMDDSSLGAVVQPHVSAFDASNIYLAASPGIASITGIKDGSASLSTPNELNPFCAEVIPDMPGGARHGARAVQIDGNIYIAGGIDAAGVFQVTLEVFCPYTNTWSQLADMLQVRAYHCFAADKQNDVLWLWGGQNVSGVDAREDVYKYEIRQNDWVDHGNMGVQRTRAGYCMIGRDLITIGGQDGAAATVDTTHYYNVNLDVGTLGPTLTQDISNNAVVVVPNTEITDLDVDDVDQLGQSGYKIYSLGGHDGVAVLDDIEVMDSRDAVWINIPSILPDARQEHGACLLEDSNGSRFLILVGGNDGVANLDTIQLMYANTPFDGPSGQVTMFQGRNQPAVAALDGFVWTFGGSDFSFTTAYANGEAYGSYKARNLQLENWSAQESTYTLSNALKRNKRDTLGFRAGHIWGVGTWHPLANKDFVRVGEAS